MSDSPRRPSPLPSSSDLPPPDYAPSQPQILITPLPDSASFFWGKTVQGEIYVKGLGEGRGNRVDIVKSLSVQLTLTNHLPQHPIIPLHTFQLQTLYPPASTSNSSSSTRSDIVVPFSTCHRFSISLPASLPNQTEHPLPGTLNLTSYEKGEIRYALEVKLILPNDQVVVEDMKIEGTPQQIYQTLSQESGSPRQTDSEVEERLEKNGVLARLLMDKDRPRLGELLRLGLEIRPVERKKGTAVFDLAKQSDPTETLRPLRRVRVELFRKVTIHPFSSGNASSSSSSTAISSTEHLTLLHATGKSLRYPGTGKKYPPLRVLFTIPTAQLGVVAEQTWGEISCTTPYHTISFFIKVTIGFGDISASRDWTLSREITIKPKKWKEPREVVIERGLQPDLGSPTSLPLEPDAGRSGSSEDLELPRNDRQDSWSEDDYRKEAYRQKGEDVVGNTGTYRLADNDSPPPFLETEGQAGPSRSGGSGGQQSELPSFLESEEQARTGEIPTLKETVRTERLVPVNFNVDQVLIPSDNDTLGETREAEEAEDRSNWVGRRGSLGGELGTWVEYDGYETFSVAPPSMAASYGANGPMDPPQEGDENNANLVGGIVARLGLDGDGVDGVRMQGLELMEHLGLGEGTRVVDLQDDLPPGIDEPSLPALPDFQSHHHQHVQDELIPSSPPPPAHAPYISPSNHSHNLPPVHDPPSFDASQAANAVGGVATSHIRSLNSTNVNSISMGSVRRPSRNVIDDEVVEQVVTSQGDAPPGYERAGEQGLPPSYS